MNSGSLSSSICAGAAGPGNLLERFKIQRLGIPGQDGLIDVQFTDNVIQQLSGDSAFVMFDQVQIGGRDAEPRCKIALLDRLRRRASLRSCPRTPCAMPPIHT